MDSLKQFHLVRERGAGSAQRETKAAQASPGGVLVSHSRGPERGLSFCILGPSGFSIGTCLDPTLPLEAVGGFSSIPTHQFVEAGVLTIVVSYHTKTLGLWAEGCVYHREGTNGKDSPTQTQICKWF